MIGHKEVVLRNDAEKTMNENQRKTFTISGIHNVGNDLGD